MITYQMMTRSSYKYIDDTGRIWAIGLVDYLALASGLERIPDFAQPRLDPLPPNFKPRHIKLVALEGRPGMQKYRTELVVNDNDYSKFLNKIFKVSDIELRCIKFVGEQRPGY